MPKLTGKTYHDRVICQELLWVNGFPTHNDVDDECCSDFSCCVPSLFEEDLGIRIFECRRMFNRLERKFRLTREPPRGNLAWAINNRRTR